VILTKRQGNNSNYMGLIGDEDFEVFMLTRRTAFSEARSSSGSLLSVRWQEHSMNSLSHIPLRLKGDLATAMPKFVLLAKWSMVRLLKIKVHIGNRLR